MAVSPHPDFLIGGRYRLEGLIASGGMADVWRATDLKLNREVAVKLLKESVIHDKTIAERFRREARALARLTHPNIVPVYDCIEEDGQVALIMRLIIGRSLRTVLDEAGGGNGKAGILSVHLTVHIGRAIASALAKAHHENIVHRDIKPGNILVMKNGEVLLTDFGIAKPLRSSADDGTDLTGSDIMMGTAKYLSPEQVQGRELDGRADIYSLGLVLYECLAGEVPYKGENDQATAIARLEADVTPLGGLRPDIPSTVIAVIHKMLRRNPSTRYRDCTEVAAALESSLQQLHDAATPVSGVMAKPSAPTQNHRRSGTLHDPLLPPRTSPNSASVLHPHVSQVAREKTPQGIARTKFALPKAQTTSMRSNYIPIALILVAAIVMSVLLWRGLQNTKSTIGAPTVSGIVVGPVSVVGLKSYDPNGDDSQENEAMIPALTDNNPTTSWTTVCYGDKYFGSKGGVGIVVQLSGIGVGTLATTFMNAPWNADVYSSTADAIPTTLDGWGLRVANSYGTEPGATKFDIKTPGRNVLLLLREVGRSTSCSNTNPYKGVLSDLSFTSGP